MSELKQAASKHFGSTYTICHLNHDDYLVAMLCNVGQPYSPHTTWLYVARNEQGKGRETKPSGALEGARKMWS